MIIIAQFREPLNFRIAKANKQLQSVLFILSAVIRINDALKVWMIVLQLKWLDIVALWIVITVAL